jgi:hypothetical protein
MPDKLLANSVFPRQSASGASGAGVAGADTDEKETGVVGQKPQVGAQPKIKLLDGELLGTIRSVNRELRQGLIRIDGPDHKMCSFVFKYDFVCSSLIYYGKLNAFFFCCVGFGFPGLGSLKR